MNDISAWSFRFKTHCEEINECEDELDDCGHDEDCVDLASSDGLFKCVPQSSGIMARGQRLQAKTSCSELDCGSRGLECACDVVKDKFDIGRIDSTSCQCSNFGCESHPKACADPLICRTIFNHGRIRNRCDCPQGLKRDSAFDWTAFNMVSTCKPLDECSFEIHNCNAEQKCVNLAPKDG
jgi:hypothetical protein